MTAHATKALLNGVLEYRERRKRVEKRLKAEGKGLETKKKQQIGIPVTHKVDGVVVGKWKTKVGKLPKKGV